MYWEGAELRLRAALEPLYQRAKEGQAVPRSVGITGARARLPKSLVPNQQELLYRRGRLETLGQEQEPLVFKARESQRADATAASMLAISSRLSTGSYSREEI